MDESCPDHLHPEGEGGGRGGGEGGREGGGRDIPLCNVARDNHTVCCSALTQTLNLTFLYVTVSTLKPTVGMVVTLWPSFNL